MGKLTVYWTSTSFDNEYSWARTLTSENGGINKENWMKGHGFSVRCIKNVDFLLNQEELIKNEISDSITFLDGVKINKSLIVKSCIAYARKEGIDELVKVENYCNCFAENIANNFNSSDLLFLTEEIETNEEFYKKALEFFYLPNVKTFAIECIKANLTDSNKNFEISSEEERKALIEIYKNSLKSQDEYSELERLVDINGYCECFIEKLLKNFSYKEIMTNSDLGSSSKFIELQVECMSKNEKKQIY